MACEIKDPTNNPICSDSLKDLKDNTIIMDQYINSEEFIVPDRLGIPRKTWAGLEKDVQDALVNLDPRIEQLIAEKIIAQGGVEIANDWGGSLEKVINQDFISKQGIRTDLESGNFSFSSGEINEGSRNTVAIGTNCLTNGKSVTSVAVGRNTMRFANNELSEAVGEYSQQYSTGSRNSSFGSLSLLSITTGNRNVAVGRQSLQCLTTGVNNTAVGYGTEGGSAPVGYNGEILNSFDFTGNSNSLFGAYAANKLYGSSSGSTVLGYSSLRNAKIANNVVSIGREALLSAGTDYSYRGRPIVKLDLSGVNYSYAGSSKKITINYIASDIKIGSVIHLEYHGGVLKTLDNQRIVVESIGASNLVCVQLNNKDTLPSLDGAGTCTINSYEVEGANNLVDSTVAIGASALKHVQNAANSIAIGEDAFRYAESVHELTAIGGKIGFNVKNMSSCTLLGHGACYDAKELRNSVIIGSRSGHKSNYINNTVILGNNIIRDNLNNSQEDVFIGGDSGRGFTDTSKCTYVGAFSGGRIFDTPLENATAIGHSSNVTGSNQVQLGNANTTTYVYGTVQNRSDSRDKKDIKNLDIGLDFVMSLTPKQFKWDYREWEGKKSGKRDHAGFIAQDLQELLKETNYAFVQDHSVNGGSDVLTIGYDEFVPVLVKAIQEQQEEINNLKNKFNLLH